ncbi:MAG: hypothetical protein AAGA56_20110, partial [Myxococcota bacterium]
MDPHRRLWHVHGVREEEDRCELPPAAPSSRRGRPAGSFTQHRRMQELRTLLAQHPRGLTLHDVAQCLHVTTRSARRYLQAIEVELEATTDRPGGTKRWRIPSTELPRRVTLRPMQAYTLLAARPVFETLRGSA